MIVNSSGVSTLAKMYSNTIIDETDWEEDTTYEAFPYRCAINIVEATALRTALIYFMPEDARNGKLSPYTITDTGVVYIYATEPVAVTIPVLAIF